MDQTEQQEGEQWPAAAQPDSSDPRHPGWVFPLNLQVFI